MKHVRLICATLALAATPVLAQPTVSSTFDTDPDGWTVINSATIDWTETGGNPDGHLRVIDEPLPPGTYEMVAPEKFLGDLRGFDLGRFMWDARTIEGQLFNWIASYGRVTIVGAAGEADHDPAPLGPVPLEWTTYTADLSAANFGVTQEQWDAILADVIEIRIQLEAYNDDDVMGFDNVILERCKVDVNEDKELNIFDFVAFQAGFLSGDPDADINADGELNVFDFIAFQAAFLEGCG